MGIKGGLEAHPQKEGKHFSREMLESKPWIRQGQIWSSYIDLLVNGAFLFF